MFKNILKFEVKFGERIYQFLCEQDAPTSEVKEMCFQILKIVGQIEDQTKAQQEQFDKERKEEKIVELKE